MAIDIHVLPRPLPCVDLNFDGTRVTVARSFAAFSGKYAPGIFDTALTSDSPKMLTFSNHVLQITLNMQSPEAEPFLPCFDGFSSWCGDAHNAGGHLYRISGRLTEAAL